MKIYLHRFCKLFLYPFLLFIISCQKNEYKDEKVGTLMLSLTSDTTYRVQLTKGWGGLDPLCIEDYQIDVIREADTIYHYDFYRDMPKQLPLFEGSYKIKASLGEYLPAGFDTPLFGGEQQFDINEDQNTILSINCALSNTKVHVAYSDDFKAYFEHYSVAMSTPFTLEPLVFEQNEERNGYFHSENQGTLLQAVLTLQASGKPVYQFKPDPINIKPCDYVKLLFKRGKLPEGQITLSITVDETTRDTILNMMIPEELLGKAKPLITPTGFVNNDTLILTQDQKPDIIAFIQAPGTIKQCLLQLNSSSLLAKGFKSEYDLTTLSEADKIQLKSLGLRWDEHMKYKTRAMIDFTPIVSNLEINNSNDVHHFTITVRDSMPIQDSSEALNLKIQISKPIFSVTSGEGDGWSNRIILRSKVEVGELMGITGFEVLKNGVWQNANLLLKTDGDEIVAELNGLEPGTVYDVRARYGEFISESIRITTEVPMSLPNSSFNDWYDDGDKYWRCWYPFAQNEPQIGWNTINKKTTAPGGKYGYCANSGTIKTSDAHSGGAAALLRTIAWGKGTTAAGQISVLKYVDAGYLYLGTFNALSAAPELGIPCIVRPRGMRFFYKYSPYRSEDRFTAEIVVEHRNETGVFELAKETLLIGGTITTYTKQDIILKYNALYRHLKATHISILFKSGEVITSDLNKNVSLIFDAAFWGTGNVHKGSELYIDDVELIY